MKALTQVIIFYANALNAITPIHGTICDLIRMILTMNNFIFNDQHYLQIHGIAIGTNKMAPSFVKGHLGCPTISISVKGFPRLLSTSAAQIG